MRWDTTRRCSSRAGGTILIGVATGQRLGVGRNVCPVRELRYPRVDTAADVTQVGRGIGDASVNGFTWQNSLQIVGGTFGAVGGFSDLAKAGGSTMVVSRWGQPGLETGNNVMVGAQSPWKWMMSGKMQPGFSNEFASYGSGQAFSVPSSTVVVAPGLWGAVKYPLGQRVYVGPSGVTPLVK